MPQTLRERAYEHIRRKIVNGEYPPGAKLSNRVLADEIGISFIPVREAISQLVSDGLVEHRPGSGAYVVDLQREHFREICDIRLAIEGLAAERMAGKMTDEDLELMRRVNEKIRGTVSDSGDSFVHDDSRSVRLIADATFHFTLLGAMGNQRAIKTLSGLRVMTFIFGTRLTPITAAQWVGSCREHDRIIDALEAGDADVARRAMVEHIDNGFKLLMATYDRSKEVREGRPKKAAGEEVDPLEAHILELEQMAMAADKK